MAVVEAYRVTCILLSQVWKVTLYRCIQQVSYNHILATAGRSKALLATQQVHATSIETANLYRCA